MIVSILFLVLTIIFITLGIIGSIKKWNKLLNILFFILAPILSISVGHAIAGINIFNMQHTALDKNLLALIDFGSCTLFLLCFIGIVLVSMIFALLVYFAAKTIKR